jgi:hypothetical protein
MFLDHREQAGGLFGVVVAVDGRLLDQLVELRGFDSGS